jgi:hypothetical protein
MNLSSAKAWEPKKSERISGTSKTFTKTKKEKPKTAAAGGGAKPPKTPPKGPTGPKDPNKDDKYGKKQNPGKSTDGQDDKMGGLRKSNSQFNDRRY